MYTVTRELDFGDLTVTVKELTVAEVRAWLTAPSPVEPKRFDLFSDLLAFDGIGMEEISRFTNLNTQQVENLPPSAIAKIAAVIKEINSVFFGQYLPALNALRERIEAQKRLEEEQA